MLVQTAGNVICNANVQRGAVFVRENVHPIVVVTHRTRNNQRCFASLNMTEPVATMLDRLLVAKPRKHIAEVPKFVIHFVRRAHCLHDFVTNGSSELPAQPMDMRLNRA